MITEIFAIPESAHGTTRICIKCWLCCCYKLDDNGDIDMSDLETKASEHGNIAP